MSQMDQVPFGASEFADNPEPRCPCLLLLDTSASMEGEPIAELNAGPGRLQGRAGGRCPGDEAGRGGDRHVRPGAGAWPTSRRPTPFSRRMLDGRRATRRWARPIVAGLEMIRQRKDAYKANGISYYRPWLFLITDGAPTDAWASGGELVRRGRGGQELLLLRRRRRRGATWTMLGKIAVREPLQLDGLALPRPVRLAVVVAQQRVALAGPNEPRAPCSRPTDGRRSDDARCAWRVRHGLRRSAPRTSRPGTPCQDCALPLVDVGRRGRRAVLVLAVVRWRRQRRAARRSGRELACDDLRARWSRPTSSKADASQAIGAAAGERWIARDPADARAARRGRPATPLR